jgi:hypothetical protein
MVDKDRTFFCSELVAKIYKVLGLLETELASSNFMPGDFSAKSNKLTLRDDCFLGPDYFIKPDPLTPKEQADLAFSRSMQKK